MGSSITWYDWRNSSPLFPSSSLYFSFLPPPFLSLSVLPLFYLLDYLAFFYLVWFFFCWSMFWFYFFSLLFFFLFFSFFVSFCFVLGFVYDIFDSVFYLELFGRLLIRCQLSNDWKSMPFLVFISQLSSSSILRDLVWFFQLIHGASQTLCLWSISC